eukprot:1392326-Amorphochlora_amoeboformis.AAC.1
MVQAFGPYRYIANLGHGMLPSMNPEALAVFIDETHKTSEEMIKEGSAMSSQACNSSACCIQ